MSTRAVRKRYGGSTEPEKLPSQSSSSSEEERPQKQANIFALLNNQPASDSSDSEEIPTPSPPPKQPVQQKLTKSKKKNSKQKRLPPETQTEADNADFDQILKEYGSPAILTSQQQTVSCASFHLFDIQPKNLSSTEELKKMFGPGAISAGREKPQANQGNREGRGNPRGQRGRGRGTPQQNKLRPTRLKPLHLTHPKRNWPPLNNFLQMELINSEAGIDYFRIVWTDDYKRTQRQFYSAVQTGDPQSLSLLLERSPYQIDTMLQLVEACKHTGQLDIAMDLLEQILYRFETLWHSLFNPIKSPNGRLEYEHESNRSFFMAFFRHIQMLSRRGCLRTALEFCKLVLSMDHGDPLGILLMIDHFCLKTGEYVYLLELYHNNDLFRLSTAKESQPEELELLPNFLFSTALAKYHIELTQTDQNSEYTLPSGKKVVSADFLLQHAIMMFPCLIMPLLNKIGVTSIPVESGDDLLFHELFSATRDYEALPLINQLITLYSNRIYGSWKDPQISKWLTTNIEVVVAKFNKGDSMIANCKAIVLEHYKDSKMSSSTQRHILLSEEEEAMQTLPPEIVREGVAIYGNEGPQNQVEAADPSAMLLFLQSLMPWFDPNAINGDEEYDSDEGDLGLVD